MSRFDLRLSRPDNRRDLAVEVVDRNTRGATSSYDCSVGTGRFTIKGQDALGEIFAQHAPDLHHEPVAAWFCYTIRDRRRWEKS